MILSRKKHQTVHIIVPPSRDGALVIVTIADVGRTGTVKLGFESSAGREDVAIYRGELVGRAGQGRGEEREEGRER